MRLLTIPFLLALGLSTHASAQPKLRALAGWYNVFPEIRFGPTLRFMLQYDAPSVGTNANGELVYSQTGRYSVATGLVREFEFTLVRDPAIKNRYDAKFLRAQPDPPEEVKLKKYTVWKWEDGRVVVVLADDRAVVTAKAQRSVVGFPVDQISAIDWAKIAEVLKSPPRTDFTPTLETFKVLSKGATTPPLQDWCGWPSEYQQTTDPPCRIYRLVDGSTVTVGGAATVSYVRHETKDGKIVDLVK